MITQTDSRNFSFNLLNTGASPDNTSDSEMGQQLVSPRLTMSNLNSFDSSHVFHFECLEPWFKEQTHCPLCNLNYSQNTTMMLN